MSFINQLKKSKYGFTLIELIVVIALLAILAAIIIPSMIAYLVDSQIRQEESNTRAAYSAACSAYTAVLTDGNNYTTNAQFTEAVIAQTLKLTTGVSQNPADGKPGHIEAEVDKDRGVVWIILTGETGCECLYTAEVNATDPFTHGGSTHAERKANNG